MSCEKCRLMEERCLEIEKEFIEFKNSWAIWKKMNLRNVGKTVIEIARFIRTGKYERL